MKVVLMMRTWGIDNYGNVNSDLDYRVGRRR